MTKHYTAVIEVHQTSPAHRVFKDGYDKVGHEVPKEKREVARVVLRDPSLYGLLEKAGKHLELLTDPEAEEAS